MGVLVPACFVQVSCVHFTGNCTILKDSYNPEGQIGDGISLVGHAGGITRKANYSKSARSFGYVPRCYTEVLSSF